MVGLNMEQTSNPSLACMEEMNIFKINEDDNDTLNL